MAKKRKFKADNLSGLWKRMDEIVQPFLAAKVRERKEWQGQLADLLDEANGSPMPGAIAQSVVQPYLSEEGEFSVAFMASGKDGFGKATAWVDMEKKQVGIDPVGLYKLHAELSAAGVNLTKNLEPDAESFERHRNLCLFREVAKLPRQYLIFLAVLPEIALAARIVAVEKRDGGYAESDSPAYLSMLWALKEFEQFYQRSQHRDLRADYGIIWHEGQWIEALQGR